MVVKFSPDVAAWIKGEGGAEFVQEMMANIFHASVMNRGYVRYTNLSETQTFIIQAQRNDGPWASNPQGPVNPPPDDGVKGPAGDVAVDNPGKP